MHIYRTYHHRWASGQGRLVNNLTALLRADDAGRVNDRERVIGASRASSRRGRDVMAQATSTPAAGGSSGWDRALGALQSVGRSLMLPIAVLPAAALLLRLGQDDLLGIPWMAAAGQAIFDNLAPLFAVGIAVGLTGGAGAAGQGSLGTSSSPGSSTPWRPSSATGRRIPCSTWGCSRGSSWGSHQPACTGGSPTSGCLTTLRSSGQEVRAHNHGVRRAATGHCIRSDLASHRRRHQRRRPGYRGPWRTWDRALRVHQPHAHPRGVAPRHQHLRLVPARDLPGA